MSNRFLKWSAIVGPMLFWLAVLVIRTVVFGEQRSLVGDLFSVAMMGVAATVFSTWVFETIDRREAEIRRQGEQLTALRNAGLTLTTELDLATVLQKVADLSRDLMHARYAALSVMDESGEYIQQFVTSGISPEQRAMMGDPPEGHGLLGVLTREGKPIRVREISEDPRSVGFPPSHPRMHSLLGVPITLKGKPVGDLYVADKIPEHETDEQDNYPEFSGEDEELLGMFAAQAGIAIENAQLYRQTQQLAILQERERFGMDLHDGIIQSIYGIGLMMEDGQLRLASEPEVANARFTQAIHDLNDVIRDIRNYILDLRPQRFQGRDLAGGLEELTRELRANSFLDVHLETDGLEASDLSPEQTVEILHIVQETMANIRKHARASRVDVVAKRQDHQLLVTVEDNGVGLNSKAAAKSSGHGLRNMRERANSLGAHIQFEPGQGGGTCVMLMVPLQARASGE